MTAPASDTIGNVPWDRIVHWYGRATDVPNLIEALKSDKHAESSEKLEYLLEHQDGVSQATPFAVAAIASIYPLLSLEQKTSTDNLLSVIKRASEFTISSPCAPEELFSMPQLLTPEFLWPPYESEEIDEELWEEYSPDRKEYYSYAKATLLCLDRFVP
jgi:hypothetical protein